jgi:hypothetical protein
MSDPMSHPMSHPSISTLIDVERYPLHEQHSDAYLALVETCRDRFERHGLCELDGFVRPDAVKLAVDEVRPVVDTAAHRHERLHNVWFLPREAVSGVAPDHPSLHEVRTSNRTICNDQIEGSVVHTIYEWEPLRTFIGAVVGTALHPMADPLARINVMSYQEGEELGWHFDRASFSTTLLLQRPHDGGQFELRRDLRTDTWIDHDAISRVIVGDDTATEQLSPEPGTLTIFAGRYTLHRVAPSHGPVDRLMTVYSFVESPGVMFSSEERLGFYGRS